MNTATEKTAVDKAQEYYNSTPADEFYFKIWGGEHIHVGIYDHPKEPIKDASPRIVHLMASKINLNANTRLLDLGSGYGGAANTGWKPGRTIIYPGGLFICIKLR